ncbi:FKBP-type peptidyl-prolyl cis-trans isomerase, partial [Mucilaginibacter sp. BJC16-A38]|uniref:FKBP-type peptidyl-prolyl cis-trans isomerase n=1 Tax=Mucilaginibacter phenanthrenivorans TaxID=1234842 RepID=UPI002157279D
SACFAGCKNTNDVPAQIRAQLAVDSKIITAYLATNNIKATMVDSAGVATGIYYIIDTATTGKDLYTSSTQIVVGYSATLLTTGKVVISTDQFHPSYVLGATIRGWQLGIAASKAQVGSRIRLFVPSHYAYGPFAQPDLGLPANAILIFDIKIYNIVN